MADSLIQQVLNNNGIKTQAAPAKTPEQIEAERQAAAATTETPEQIAERENSLFESLKQSGVVPEGINSFSEFKTKVTAPPAPKAEPTAEEIEQAKARKKNEARAWSLSQGKATTEEYDHLAKDAERSALDIVKSNYIADRQKDTKKLDEAERPTVEELEAEFNDIYHLNLKEDDPRRKRGESLIAKEAKEYMYDKYGKILTVDTEYDKHLSSTEKRTAYNSNIDKAVNILGAKIIIPIGDQNFEYTIPESRIKALKEQYLNDEHITSALISGEATPEAIAVAMRNAVVSDEIAGLLEEVSDSIASGRIKAMKKGRRGIPDLPGNAPLLGKQPEAGLGKAKISNPGIRKLLSNPENQKIIQSPGVRTTTKV